MPPLTQVEIPRGLLFHSVTIKDRDLEDLLALLKGDGVWKGEGKATYLSTEIGESLGHINPLEEGEIALLIEVDTEVLFKLRNIYNDPESLDIVNEKEFGINFVIKDGIPHEAIKKIRVLEQVES